jgi:hypothetical protein
MQTRNKKNKKRIQKLIVIQKLKVNELLQIRGGESDPIDNEII